MIHRWLARLPASLIYLRDATRTHYLQGVQSLAPTRDRPALAQQVGKVDNRADCNRITASLFRAITCTSLLASSSNLLSGRGFGRKFHTDFERRAYQDAHCEDGVQHAPQYCAGLKVYRRTPPSTLALPASSAHDGCAIVIALSRRLQHVPRAH
jgi:hypothetical protein